MTASPPQMFEARVRAVLGPTNTGKTHLAITRLLAHASGIIGFPLRLLARENYDRMVAAKGAAQVALITGEEKIVPPGARWFACTVEAMPLDRRAEFVAVDEIQLCADPDRGHVFTDRLLRARGLVETMFLGAETIAPLLRRLVPGVEIETRPRLSQLTYAGPAKLTRLPPRSAVVAFSATEVYAIAEAIRRRRGGCAVVMGRLSPRTRNAQVALYQAREVDFLVATDAIGMGLNMDVDHVAFASLAKFDGHGPRPLTAQEAAQIAGRAGRGMRDGTFGATAELEGLPDEVVAKVEGHSFEALQTLAWRNAALDFSGLDALLDSLAAPPPGPGLAKGHDATDHVTLAHLAREAEVREAADSRGRVRLLWEACQVPDFRKLADDSHTRMCSRLFLHLARDGALPAEWVAGHVAALTRDDGDLDTLMARLAGIRVWAYVAARGDWLKDAATLQAEARRAEDMVSDALHERLTARFVDRRAAHLIRRLDDTEEELLSAVTRQGEVVVEGHPVGRIEGFVFTPDPAAAKEEDKRLVLRAARRALREEVPRRVAALEATATFAFAPVEGRPAAQAITWDGVAVAVLRRGAEPARPVVEVIDGEFLDGAQRERVRVRLAAWLEAEIARDLAPLAAAEAKAAGDGALRGPVFTLREHLGLLPGGTEGAIASDLRVKLKAIGVRAGRHALFLPEMLKPRAMALRARLWALAAGLPVPVPPSAGLVSLPRRAAGTDPVPPVADAVSDAWPDGFAEAMGWVAAGPVWLRLDVAERVAGELGFLTRRAPALAAPDLASRLGVKGDALEAALAGLGFRLLPAEIPAEDRYGPPLPARIAAPRPRDHARDRAPSARRGADPERARPDDRRRADPPPTARGLPEGVYGPPRPPRAETYGPPRPPLDLYYGPPRPPREPGAEGERPGRRRRGPRPGDAAGHRPDPAPAAPPREARRDGRPRPDRAADSAPGPAPAPAPAGQDGGPRREARGAPPRRDGRPPPPAGAAPGRQGGRGGERPRERGGRDGGGGGGGERTWSAGPAPSRGPDPDSPFAVLARLKLR